MLVMQLSQAMVFGIGLQQVINVHRCQNSLRACKHNQYHEEHRGPHGQPVQFRHGQAGRQCGWCQCDKALGPVLHLPQSLCLIGRQSRKQCIAEVQVGDGKGNYQTVP